MRLWSIHPKYLDARGLTAVWREGLLAKAVLDGKTSSYRNHPQMIRFDSDSINLYLYHIWEEAAARGYNFDRKKIGKPVRIRRVNITDGQLDYELRHLRKKLAVRSRRWHREVAAVRKAEPHPIFSVKKGPVEKWEKVSSLR